MIYFDKWEGVFMTDEEYEELRKKEKLAEQKKETAAFDDLLRSARSVRSWTLFIAALLIVGAVLVFFYQKLLFATALALFFSGCIIGVIGGAISSIMEALSEHMRDTREVRKNMDRRMEKIEKRNDP